MPPSQASALTCSRFDTTVHIFYGRLVSVGNLEAAVSLLLSTSPESSYFYANALRAVALSSAVSRSLLELAVKVSAIGTTYALKIQNT